MLDWILETCAANSKQYKQHLHTYTCTRTCIHIHTRTHTHAHTHTHTHSHILTHCVLNLSSISLRPSANETRTKKQTKQSERQTTENKHLYSVSLGLVKKSFNPSDSVYSLAPRLPEQLLQPSALVASTVVGGASQSHCIVHPLCMDHMIYCTHVHVHYYAHTCTSMSNYHEQ